MPTEEPPLRVIGVPGADQPDPRLPDESGEAFDVARIAYWVDVYGQILKYKERLLSTALDEAEMIASDIARRYVMEADTVPLAHQVELCLARYQLWTQRLTEVSPDTAQGGERLLPTEEN